MRVVTYLGFTVLSIFIQFCVMDFIQEKVQEKPDKLNITYERKAVDDLLKNISSKPHALYYRTHMSKSLKKSHGAIISFTEKSLSNSSVTTMPLGTTDISTTIFDILYDENTSATEITPTTESFITTTEFDNITIITFFETKNKSSNIPNAVPKIRFTKYCSCNLLYEICDINCCCDQDCTSDEHKQFYCEKKNSNVVYNDGCISHLLDGDIRYGRNSIDTLLCIVKSNLPDRHSVRKMPNVASIDQYNKWKHVRQEQRLYEFTKYTYKQADPIWLLKNGTVYYLDFPIPMINNYCTDRSPITFLKEENIQCLVKFNDLEMFHISKTKNSVVISATETTFNSSALNCSNLHCVNWTILACENGVCNNYNKSLNEASCTESACTNVALKIEYFFYYQNFKIMNATIKLHIQKTMSNVLPFMSQEILVKFIMSNKSLDRIVEFSGNPGCISHLPIIVSYAKANHTDHFFNNTTGEKHLTFPENQNGICILSNSSQNVVRFGLNKRTKCRYVHAHRIVNHTNVCKSVQDKINDFLRLNREVSISPFGNPYGINDENWIKLQTEVDKQESEYPVYGEYNANISKLHCYNLINKIYFILMFANVDEKDFISQNKILLAKYEVVRSNITFNIEDITMVLTIDINFVDATKPNYYVYAGSPHLNIHLPKDFFFPFPPNNCYYVCNSYLITIICCTIISLSNKITLG